jgi:hypothetical protein
VRFRSGPGRSEIVCRQALISVLLPVHSLPPESLAKAYQIRGFHTGWTQTGHSGWLGLSRLRDKPLNLNLS